MNFGLDMPPARVRNPKKKSLVHMLWFWMCLGPAILDLGAESWRFSANEVKRIDRENESRTVLSGDAYAESDTMRISAHQLELSGKDYEYISGSDKIAFIDTERRVSVNSERLEYNRITEVIGFRERVVLVDEENDVVIHCESLDFRQEENLMIMQILVRLIKGDTVCRGEFATLWVEEDVLEVSGHPAIWREGDVYRADRILINLETDEIELIGAVEGTLIVTEDEEE